MEQEPFGPDPQDRRGAALDAPPWLQGPGELPEGPGELPEGPGELPTAGGAGYLDAARRPGPQTPGSLPPRRRRRKTRLLTAAMVVAVALLAAVAVFVTRHPGGKAGHTPSPAPAGSRNTAAGQSAPGASSALTSPRSVSAALIFPQAHVLADGLRFSRVIVAMNKQCARAARGAFATALNSAGCQSVTRATFADTGRRYAITAGVAELPSAASASQADSSGRFGPDVWFTGLNGPPHSGATAVSRSVGFGYEVVYGRYIIYALATYSDGRNPTGHAGKVRMLKNLSRSFTALVRQSLLAAAK